MQNLVLLGMYIDAVVVFVTSQTILLKLALAILCNERLLRYKLLYTRIFGCLWHPYVRPSGMSR